MRKLRLFLISAVLAFVSGQNLFAQGLEDITSKLKNPALDSKDGWTFIKEGTKDWSNIAGAAPFNVVEAYAGWGELGEITTFTMKQDVTLDAGTYRFVSQSFHRGDVGGAKVFAKVGETVKEVDVAKINQFQKWPDNVEQASKAFATNAYLNVVEFTVESNSTVVTLGIDGEHKAKQEWFIAGPCKLYAVKNEVSSTYPLDVTHMVNRANTAIEGVSGTYESNVWVHEKYSETPFPVGDIMSTAITGLENGTYQVEIYAAASSAWGKSSVPAEKPYLYANDVKVDVTATETNGVNPVPVFTLDNVVVSDGTLNLGFSNRAEGSNWNLFYIKSIKMVAPAAPAVPEVATWKDIKVDFTNNKILTEAETNIISVGIKMNEDGTATRVAADDASANAVVTGKWHSTQHGLANFSATVKVEGPVKIGMGSCAWGGNVTVKDENGVEVANAFNTNNGACWATSNGAETNVIYTYYKGEAATLTIAGGSYTPYFSVEKIALEDIPQVMKVSYSLGESGATGILPANFELDGGKTFTIPVNRTLYVEGKTLTGWTDGTKTYAIGEEVTAVADTEVSFAPVFTDNTVSLADRKDTVNIVWDFQQKNGAPVVAVQGKTMIWVAQAVVNGQTIDVKMDIDATSGKVANGNWQDWCQINGGTKLTIPAAKDAVIGLESYSATTTTTIAGDVINQETKTPSYTYTGEEATVDIVIGDGSYWRTVAVALPAPAEPLGTYITFPTTIAFDETTAPFTGGVIKANDNIGNVLTVHTESDVEPAEAKFDAEVETYGAQPYVLATTDKVTVSFVMYAGWQSGGKDTKFAVKNSAGTELFSYTYNAASCNVTDVAIGGNTVSGFAAFAAQSKASSKNANGFDNGKSQGYVATADNNTTVTLTISGSGAISATFLQKAKSLDKTFNASLSDDVVKDLASLNITSAVTLADRACGFDNFSITKETVEEATYVVKGLVDDTEIYSDTLYAEVGSTPTVAAVDYYDVENGNKKYIYLDDDASSKTVAKDGSTVVNVFYREAETYKYSIQAVNAEGELLQALSTNSNYEGENITVSYPAYVLNTADSTLYEAAATSSQYNKTITLTEAEQALNITYNKTDITNVIYLQEGEDIWGMTKSTHGNSYVRSSNASAGYPAEGDVDITELSTGKYKLSVVFFNAKSSEAEFKFTLGGDSLCSLKSTGINKSSNSSDEFTVIGRNVPLTILQGGSNDQGIDIVYIQKTGVVPPTEVANIGALKDVEEGVEVKLALTDAVVNLWSGDYTTQSMASYIEDATGAIKFDTGLSNIEWMRDSIAMNGYIYATYGKDYDGIPQLSVSDSTIASKVDTVAAVPTSKVMTVADASAESVISRYVKFEKVEFAKKVVDEWGTTEYYLVQGTDTISFFDKFSRFGWGAMPDFKSFDEVQGFISMYDGKFEFYPFGEYKANYTPAVVVENIAAAKAVENGTNVNLTLKDAKVTAYVASKWGAATAFIEDASGAIQISGDALSAIGVENDSTILNGNIYVKYVSEGGATQLNPGDSIAYSKVEAKEGAVSPTTMAVKDIKAETNVARYIEIAFPSFKYDEENYCYVAIQEGDTIMVVDNFGWMNQNFEMDDEYNLILPDSVTSIKGIVMWDDYFGYKVSVLSMEEYVAPQDIVVNVTEGDIAAAVETAKATVKKVGKITINLTEGAAYTIANSIVAPASLVINGNGATVDATALAGAIVSLNGTEAQALNQDGTENANYKMIDSVAINNVVVKSLVHPIVKDAQKTLVGKLVVDNSVIEISGSYNVFDFASKGYPTELSVNNSTIWSKDGHKGYLLQSGGRVKDLDPNQTEYKQIISIANSTLHKISVGKQFNNLSGKGQKSLVLSMTSTITSDCTVNGNEVRGWLGGQNSNNPSVTYDKNTYWAEGAVQAGWTNGSQGSDATGTSLTTNPGFKDVASGDFTVYAGSEQAKQKIGDPRWLVEFDETLTGIDGINAAATLNGAVYTINGIKVREAGETLKGLSKGMYIINGKKYVVK